MKLKRIAKKTIIALNLDNVHLSSCMVLGVDNGNLYPESSDYIADASLANFKNEDFEYFDYINHLMEDSNILELFNKYSNDELKKRLYFLTEYYKKIKFKTIIKKKTRF